MVTITEIIKQRTSKISKRYIN